MNTYFIAFDEIRVEANDEYDAYRKAQKIIGESKEIPTIAYCYGFDENDNSIFNEDNEQVIGVVINKTPLKIKEI